MTAIIIFDKIVHYYLDFLDLCCIHTVCITLESLDHAVQCLWGVEIYRAAVAMETLLDYALLYAYFAK